jgi:hypothetical protein
MVRPVSHRILTLTFHQMLEVVQDDEHLLANNPVLKYIGLINFT